MIVVNIARDNVPVPTPTPLSGDRVVLALIQLKIQRPNESISLTTVKRGVMPTVLEAPVVTTGAVSVKDALTVPGCTASIVMGADTLQMTVGHPNDGGEIGRIEFRFTGAKSWRLKGGCIGGNTFEIAEATFRDLFFPPAMDAYRDGAAYQFRPAPADPNEQCLTRYGHYEGRDTKPLQTVTVTLDLYVHRGDCTFLIPDPAD
jgi:hypothetical protein